MIDFQDFFVKVDKYLKTTTYPVAVQLADEIPSDARILKKMYGHRLALCQALALARRFGWKIAFRPEDWGCAVGMSLFGFAEIPPPEIQAEVACPLYTATPEAGLVMQEAMPRLPAGSGKTLIFAGPDKMNFEPDVIIIYGQPFQIARCIHAAMWEEGHPVKSKFPGRAACAYEIIVPLQSQRCQVIIPGGGERAFAGTQDDEMSFAVPQRKFESFIKGLEATHKAGANRIPTPSLGITMEPPMPRQYDKLARFMGIFTEEE